MKGPSLCHGRLVRGRCRADIAGAALILTLAFIVILTAVVLLFLSRSLLQTQVSVASADQTAAALFARGAVDAVIGELKQEITAGSVATYPPTGSDVRDPNCVFLPTNNLAMVPYRMDSGAPSNVLKRSSSNEAFYSGSTYNLSTYPAPTWAANSSTTNPGTGGRYISLARWNEPLLMPTASTTSTNLTPATSFIPPDWVYQTRTNGPASTWNANLVPNTLSGALNGNCVVGRFAYVVYDEGGLLDANAAGYPSAAEDGSTITPVMMRHKISEACADLTQIGLNNSDITNLVAWRNPSNDATATMYTSYVYSPNTNAFLTPAPSERLFTSRQQLIDFLMQNIATNNPPDIERMQGALPYLTTFSRELNQPSWYPQTNMATTGYAYSTIATNTSSSATNPFVPLERATAIYTNTSLLVCNPNQPVAFSRFPLSRLSWLTSTGPATVSGISSPQLTADIQQSFGLVWDATYSAWQYVGAGSTVQSAIANLSQFNNREPNFFELLKAALLTGSVGVGPYGDPFNLATIDPRYLNSDMHVIEIGLSMMDQASPAILPTRIEFGPNNTGANALYGNKNLPYLYNFVFSPYRPLNDNPPGQNFYDAWLEPVYWNPYQISTTNTAGALDLRIRATMGNIGTETAAPTGTPGVNTYSVPPTPSLPVGAAGTGASIEVLNANAAAFSSNAANPVMLNTVMSQSGMSTTITDSRVSPWGGTSPDIYNLESGTTYAGFWLGHAYAPDPIATMISSPATTNYNISFPYFESGHNGAANTVYNQFIVEANYGGTAGFQEVQRMNFGYETGVYFGEYDNFTVLGRRESFYCYNDPRTSRFGFNHMWAPDYTANETKVNTVSAIDAACPTWTTFYSPTQNFATNINEVQTNSPTVTFNPNLAQGSAGGIFTKGSGLGYPADMFRLADNSASPSSPPNANTYVPLVAYADGDGAQRQADGWWSSTATNTLPMRGDTPSGYASGSLPYRPVMLNRPFYSVGELGYVFRDMPWRSLNFSSSSSPDAGLLDFFCINDGYAGSTNAPVVAGVLDLNTSQPKVLRAMLNGAARAELYPGTSSSTPAGFDVTATEATSMAANITGITTTLPLLNKSEIATRLTAANADASSASTDSHIKERQETIVRALASAGQVRTWNLMIDVVAQTGHFPPGASGFNNFIVTAEQRYWAHVAIDRYTGQVVSMQLEPVSE